MRNWNKEGMGTAFGVRKECIKLRKAGTLDEFMKVVFMLKESSSMPQAFDV